MKNLVLILIALSVSAVAHAGTQEAVANAVTQIKSCASSSSKLTCYQIKSEQFMPADFGRLLRTACDISGAPEKTILACWQTGIDFLTQYPQISDRLQEVAKYKIGWVLGICTKNPKVPSVSCLDNAINVLKAEENSWTYSGYINFFVNACSLGDKYNLAGFYSCTDEKCHRDAEAPARSLCLKNGLDVLHSYPLPTTREEDLNLKSAILGSSCSPYGVQASSFDSGEDHFGHSNACYFSGLKDKAFEPYLPIAKNDSPRVIYPLGLHDAFDFIKNHPSLPHSPHDRIQYYTAMIYELCKSAGVDTRSDNRNICVYASLKGLFLTSQNDPTPLAQELGVALNPVKRLAEECLAGSNETDLWSRAGDDCLKELAEFNRLY